MCVYIFSRLKCNRSKNMSGSYFCPMCGLNNLNIIENGKDNVKIKNEEFEVNATFSKCDNCEEKFYTPEENINLIEAGRKLYRKKYIIPSPNEIKDFMTKYNLSLRDMERLTGIAFKTIDKYLKGAIPIQSNANLLRNYLYYPQIFFDTVTNAGALSERKSMKIVQILLEEEQINSTIQCGMSYGGNIFMGEVDRVIQSFDESSNPWVVTKDDEEDTSNQEYKYAC